MHRGDRGFEAIEQLCRDAIEASGAEMQLTKPAQGAASGGTAQNSDRRTAFLTRHRGLAIGRTSLGVSTGCPVQDTFKMMGRRVCGSIVECSSVVAEMQGPETEVVRWIRSQSSHHGAHGAGMVGNRATIVLA